MPRLLIDLRAEYWVIEARDALPRDIVAAHGGVVVSTAGNSVFVVFADTADADDGNLERVDVGRHERGSSCSISGGHHRRAR